MWYIDWTVYFLGALPVTSYLTLDCDEVWLIIWFYFKYRKFLCPIADEEAALGTAGDAVLYVLLLDCDPKPPNL